MSYGNNGATRQGIRHPEAFQALYREHHPTVRRYLAAETFLIAWRRARELPPHELPWLFNVAAKAARQPGAGRPTAPMHWSSGARVRRLAEPDVPERDEVIVHTS